MSPRPGSSIASPSIRTSSAAKVSPAAVARMAWIVQYSRAVKPRISRSRSTTSRTATDCTRPADRPRWTFLRQQRAQRVADQAVDDAARLLRVDEVHVDLARVRERLADRRFGDLVEGDPLRLLGRDVGGLGDVPGDRLALAVEVGGEIDLVRALGGLLDVGDLLAPVVGDHVLRFEVVVDVDAELALARVFGQVADMAIGGKDAVVATEIALDGARLGRRFDDDEVLGHGRECSTGSLPHPFQTSRIRRRKSSSISRSASTSGAGGWFPGASSVSASPRQHVHRGVGPGDGARRDLHEPDVEIREEEDRLDVVDEDRPLAVHHPQIRAAQADVARRGRLVQVGEQRLLVVEMQDDVADHAPMVAPERARCQPADGPVRGGRSRPPGGPARPRPRRRSRHGCRRSSSCSGSGRRCTTSRSGS